MSQAYGKRSRTRITPRPDGKAGVYFGSIERSAWPDFRTWMKIQDLTVNYNQPDLGAQTTVDYVHPGPPFTVGGPFESTKTVNDMGIDPMQGNGVHDAGLISGQYYRYRGGFGMPVWPAYTAGVPLPSLDPWTLVAFNKLKPRMEKASLGVAVAEARDLPRMLSGTARSFHEIWKGMGGNAGITTASFRRHAAGNYLRMSPKRRADEFLNIQFGWMPFLRDLGDFIDVFKHGRMYIRDLTRRNNTWEHRRKSLLLQTTPEELLVTQDTQCVQPVLPTNYFNVVNGKRYSFTLHKSTWTNVWATGWFKFYRPEFDASSLNYNSDWNKVQQGLTLLGARINPSVIWKATPWSWLSDWFTSVGNVVDNVTAAGSDGVVSKNLCVMCHYTQVFTLRVKLNLKSGERTLTFIQTVEGKQRSVAVNPYGFGLLPNQLTGMQYAILAALGLGRRRS